LRPAWASKTKANAKTTWAGWYMPVILALERLRQEENDKFEARIGYITSLRLPWPTL
jgi:hypothetical protein